MIGGIGGQLPERGGRAVQRQVRRFAVQLVAGWCSKRRVGGQVPAERIVGRLIGAIPTLLIIIAMAFFMMRLAPGGPFDQERRLPPEIEKNILAAYDLDKPVLQQFFDVDMFVCGAQFSGSTDVALAARGLRLEDGKFLDKNDRRHRCLGGYVGKLLAGDFGPSYKYKDFTVAELIADGAPVSFPAAYEGVMAVGAVDSSDVLADFSNIGSALDVVAPGVGVLSSLPRNQGRDTGLSIPKKETFAATELTFSSLTPKLGLNKKLVDCGLGHPGECPASVKGQLALVQRGELFFSDKVINAMAQGAVGVVIFNNAPGSFAGTLQTPVSPSGKKWVPTIGVTDATTAGPASGRKTAPCRGARHNAGLRPAA